MFISLTNTNAKFVSAWQLLISVKEIYLAASFFILLLFLLVASCSELDQVNSIVEEKKTVYTAPVRVLLDTAPKPGKVDLDTVPPPLILRVPEKMGGFYRFLSEKGVETIHLSPPIITKAKAPIANFTHFNTEQGLASSLITCSLLDSKGNFWFGAYGGGLSRYDGTGFTNFTVEQGLASTRFRSIVEDNIGNIWIGTEGAGLICYDGVRFKNFTKADGLADDIIYSMLKDKKGNLWIGTYEGGVSLCNPSDMGSGFINLDTSNGLPSNNVNTIAEDKNGNLWFGTFGGGACRYNPGDGKTGFTTFTKEQGLPDNKIVTIKEDSKGNLWFGTWEGGLSRYNPEQGTNSFTTFTTEQGLANNTVICVAEDNSGNIWFGTLGGGISLYDGNKFTNYSIGQGLTNNNIMCITVDKVGNLWIGTSGGGGSRYNGSSINDYASGQGLPTNPMNCLVEDKDGNLWLSYFGYGVIRYDGKSFTSFTASQGLAGNSVFDIAAEKSGNIWFGDMDNGVSRFDGKSFTNYTTRQGLANNRILSILVDKSGNIWFATMGSGVSRFDGKSFTNYTTQQGLASNSIVSIGEGPDGDIWFGTKGSGVSRYDGNSFTTFNAGQGLANNEIAAIKTDKSGNLWFGLMGGGLCRFDGSGFINYTTRNGLADDNVYDLVEDEKGVIWVGTNLGFSSLKFKTPGKGDQPGEIIGAGMFNLSNEQLSSCEPVWDIFNTKTGYPVKDLIQQSMSFTMKGLTSGNKDEKGIIWGACGDQKIIRFDPKAVFKIEEMPAVYIRSIKVNEENINWYGLSKKQVDSGVITQQESMVFGKSLSVKVRDSLHKKFSDIKFDSITPFYQVPQNLILPYRNNRVSFDFGAIETNRPFMVRYQYMLVGYDKEWSPVTDKTSASFGNISEGRYTFKLKARSPEGVWSEPISYSFKILPPWWRTWWAYLLYFLLFSFCIYAVFQWRIKSLKQEKLKLEEKISKRTLQLEQKSTELEQSLESLKSTQSQLVQSEKMASLGELTAGIAHEIQNPLNFVNNFSDVNQDLIDELNEENDKGNSGEVKIIAGYIKENEAKINQHGKRADAIVKGMLQHSRTSSGQKESTDINALVDEYLRLAYHGFRAIDKSITITMEKDFDQRIGKINIIPQDIGRVLLNLYNNTFYAVMEKQKKADENYLPKMTVSTRLVPVSENSTISNVQAVIISVKDNGMGIPEKVKEKIFQPFFTTKPTGQGTGLGLSLSFDIIKAHGGAIKVESREGEGSVFLVILPSV